MVEQRFLVRHVLQARREVERKQPGQRGLGLVIKLCSFIKVFVLGHQDPPEMILGARNGFVGPVRRASLIQSQTEKGPERGMACQYLVGHGGEAGSIMVEGTLLEC